MDILKMHETLNLHRFETGAVTQTEYESSDDLILLRNRIEDRSVSFAKQTSGEQVRQFMKLLSQQQHNIISLYKRTNKLTDYYNQLEKQIQITYQRNMSLIIGFVEALIMKQRRNEEQE